MKSILFGLVLILSGFAQAEIPTVTELRTQNASLLSNVEAYTMNCGQRVENSVLVAQSLDEMKASVVAILAEQKELKNDINADRLLELITLAKNQLAGLETDCLNGTTYTKMLLEMYFTNIDTELVIFQYGVGASGYRR